MYQYLLLLKQHGEITFSPQPHAYIEREPLQWGEDSNKPRDEKAEGPPPTPDSHEAYFEEHAIFIISLEIILVF